jgi:phasin family protein
LCAAPLSVSQQDAAQEHFVGAFSQFALTFSWRNPMNTLNSAAEQFGDFSKSNVDAALKFATMGFGSAERLIALNLEAAKVSFDVTSKNAKAVSSVKDVQELSAIQAKAAETGLEFAVGYSKNFYDVATSAQNQYSAFVEERMSQFQKSMVDTLDKAAKSAPAGSDVFVTAMKNGLAATTAASDSFSKAAKQMTTFADTAFKSATETAEKVTKPATKRK